MPTSGIPMVIALQNPIVFRGYCMECGIDPAANISLESRAV